MTEVGKFEICGMCGRGAEACKYCERVTLEDWEVICDCGLYDFGNHLFQCELMKDRRYLIE